jgi:hypothetical protein
VVSGHGHLAEGVVSGHGHLAEGVVSGHGHLAEGVVSGHEPAAERPCLQADCRPCVVVGVSHDVCIRDRADGKQLCCRS